VSYRLDAHLSKVSSVQTTRTFRPDLSLCQEVSNCSSLHLSGRFSSTSGQLSVYNKLQDFFPKHSYGKIAATVRTTWIPIQTRLSIRQVPHSQPVSMVQTRVHQIWKVRASNQPSGRSSRLSGRVKPLFGNYLQQKCDRPDNRAALSEHGSKAGKNFSEILRQLISQLSVRTAHDYCPDGA
jgi:hypothetical protein